MVIAAAVVIGLMIWANRANAPAEDLASQEYGTPTPTFTQVKSAHFVDSTPLHGEVYAAQPINITINFNFDLGEGSRIRVHSASGQEWQAGEADIEDGRTALTVPLKAGMPDGNYAVDYTACWPDKSCHDGKFSFAVNSAQRTSYTDLRGQKEIAVPMKEIAFVPSKIIISPGTKVIWVNNDNVGHYVNTETHPEHTYFPSQNSREIPAGQSFTATFTAPGQYNYHCSAHVPEGMLGSIIVAQ